MKKLIFLLLIFSGFIASAQTITGVVKDEHGHNLPFASILVKGTPKGVSANNEGKFSITLPAGKYTLDCRYVGYTSSEKEVTVDGSDVTVNFVLTVQKLTLKEVIVKQGEDPAYEIIRNAIKKRSFYENQVKAFQAQVYIKGIIRVNNLPSKIFGKKIPEEDREEMGLDSLGNGIVYLTESVTKINAEQPDKFKLEVISTRVSGNNGLGFSFPTFISFYNNNIDIASQLNPRGFVSPIADNALNFYNYKFLGSFFQGGNEVNVISVMPKRKYEPLFSGTINITENDWRIYSCNLMLTKTSQLQILDTLNISQIYVPIENDIWRIKNHVLHFDFNQFGLRSEGDFVNVYSDYNLNPAFPKGFFDRVVIKYDTGVNKKTHSYWDSIRPIPLEPAELKDYKTKDSLFAAKDSAALNLDSLRKKQGPVTLTQIFWSGVNHTRYNKYNTYLVQFEPLLKTIQYNTVEGLAINPSLVISKNIKPFDTEVKLITDVQYGFNNNHLNPWAGFIFHPIQAFDPDRKFREFAIFVAGGKRVSQFFKESDLDGLGNSIGTLLYGNNFLKIYENYFAKGGFRKQWESGTSFLIEGEYEDRLPIDNTTDFILNDKWLSRLTPNYPVQILSHQFPRHQAVVLHTSLTLRPGRRYIQFPKYKMAIDSKLPMFTLDYTKGIKNIFGSDVNYDKWAFNGVDVMNLKLAGDLKYSATVGGFFNSKGAFAQDYKHFYVNTSHIAGQYVKAFQNVYSYEFSNTSAFYAELHLEHHSNGLLTNKIPLLKKLNWNLVEGLNALYIHPDTRYEELFVGLENIFKIFRFDVVASFQNGQQPTYVYRIGFGGLIGDVLNVQRFKRTEKIIDVW